MMNNLENVKLTLQLFKSKVTLSSEENPNLDCELRRQDKFAQQETGKRTDSGDKLCISQPILWRLKPSRAIQLSIRHTATG